MLNDRYMPVDESDDYELTLEDSGRHSHKHDRKHKRSKKEKKHREASPNKRHHNEKRPNSQELSERSTKLPAANELEDGEIMEDGEVVAVDEQQTSERLPGSAKEGLGDPSTSKRRSSSPTGKPWKQRHSSSSQPPTDRDRAASQERSTVLAAADESSKDHVRETATASHSARERRSSRERSRERSRSRRDREQPPSQHHDAEGDLMDRPSRHSSRDPREYRSSSSAAGRTDSRLRDRSDPDRDRDHGRYERERDRGGRYDRDRLDRDRHRVEAAGRDDRRRRNSRSRSRDRRLAPPRSFEERQKERAGAKTFEERERERERYGSKRSRDERDRGENEKRHRRSYSSEAELDLPDLPDPDALAAVDPLGLTAAEREAEEERKRLEESRRRRQEILAKHQQTAAITAPTATAAADQQQQEQQHQQHQEGAAAEENGVVVTTAAAPGDAQDGTATPEGERSSSDDSQNAPGPVFDIWNKRQDAADGEVNSKAAAEVHDEPTSQLPVHLVAQTEPNMQSERLRVGVAAPAATNGTEQAAAAAAVEGDDMFAAEDDMFAAEGEAAAAAPKKAVVPAGLQDNYDDAEGYYNFQVGEVLDSRYEVFACKGKGVFSTVLRARDLLRHVNSVTGQPVAAGTAGAEQPEVAIKVIRSNETMSKAAALEQRILRLLSEKDPDNRKHVIRLLRTFEFRQHVCMVFEPMDMNLRELTLKYGRNVGLNINAVAIYASQLLVALRHLQQCRVLHADIKPDNILVNARRSKVKICDLGSAMLAGENERTPYLVSRFYRAPEVILGLAYDFPMDMWSVGCVVYELFTGKILFPGRTNNEMLKLMMDVKGPFPKKMLKKGIFVEKHFEDDVQTSFALIEEDPVTKQPVRRVITNPTVKHNFAQLLARAEGDRTQVAALADLLERMCALDPEKRIDPDSALRHPFVKPWLPKKKSATAAGQ